MLFNHTEFGRQLHAQSERNRNTLFRLLLCLCALSALTLWTSPLQATKVTCDDPTSQSYEAWPCYQLLAANVTAQSMDSDTTALNNPVVQTGNGGQRGSSNALVFINTPSVFPEPNSLTLLGLGLSVLAS